MDYSFSNLHSLWAHIIVDELIRLGCDTFVLAPGSRSTPLTIAIARHKKAKVMTCYDERSAGFFALGYARAQHKAAALVVTSGTAVANLFPALIEASNDRIPMILLTADRPWELRSTGANQTIDQVKIFGDYPRFFSDLPAPDDRVSMRALLSTIDYAFAQSMQPLPGPVHINCMFREPLGPNEVESIDDRIWMGLEYWCENDKPLTQYQVGANSIADEQMHELMQLINRSEKGVLVAASLRRVRDQEAIIRLAHRLEWPLIADITSCIRMRDDPLVIHYADQLLVHPRFSNDCPDLVIQFGGHITSKRVQQWLDRRAGQRHLYVDDHLERQDPGFTVTHRVRSDIATWCEDVIMRAGECKSHFLEAWCGASNELHQFFDDFFDKTNHLSEPLVARTISKRLNSAHALFISSSMPIRDLDMFATCTRDTPVLAANRGASGIDGVISSACGFAYGCSKTTTLLIGDLAFLHDGNGLSLLSKISTPVVIVVINNRGGGIFSFLPISKSTDVFEPFFTMPHDHALAGLAQVFRVPYTLVSQRDEFDRAYTKALQAGSHHIIEVQSETSVNWTFHEAIKSSVLEKFSR